MAHIVKRRGHKEAYDERKIYASIYAAALNAHIGKLEAEKMAQRVSRRITDWIDDIPDMTSEKIFRKAAELLREEHPDAAFMYETHRDIA